MSASLESQAKQAMTPRTRRVQVINPNLGFYNDRSALSMPDRAMSQCSNARIRHGQVTNERMGWLAFAANSQLPDPITWITNFRQRSGASNLLACSVRDVAVYDAAGGKFDYLTPRYATGTVTVPASPSVDVTGAGGALWVTEGIKMGDFIHFGDAAQVSSEEDWFEVATVGPAETELTLTTAPGAQVAVVYTLRKTLLGQAEDSWDDATFPKAQPSNEDTWYGANGSELVSWNGVSTVLTILSLGFTARKLAYYKNMLYYGDLDIAGERRPTSVRNSDVASPEITDGSGTSGENSVVNGTDRIMAMEILGDHLVVLAEQSINIMEFVGDPIGHTIRTALWGIGPFADRLVINQGDYLEFVSHDRSYRFDGVGKSEFGSQVFREVLRATDSARAYQSHAYRDEEEGEILWCVALTTDVSGYPSTCHTEHYIEPVGSRDPTPFTVRQLPATALGSWTQTGVKTFATFAVEPPDDFSQQTIRWNDRSLADDAPITIMGDKDGKFWLLNAGETLAGAPLWVIFTLGRQVAIDGQVKGMIRTIEPYLHPQTTGQVVPGVNCFDRALDSPEHRTTFGVGTFELDRSGPRRIPLRTSGRYVDPIFIALGDSTGSLVWSFNGYELEIVPGGKR